MISNEIITNTHNAIALLLPLTRNVSVYKESISNLHNQIMTFYKSLQLHKNWNLNQIEIHKFQKFINIATQFSHILKYFQHYLVNSAIAFSLHNVFNKIDKLQKIIVKLSRILSINEINIQYNSETNYKNRIYDLQHLKTVLSTIHKSSSLISNLPDIDKIVTFYLDFINIYFEKYYDKISNVLNNLNVSSSISNTEILQIKKELSLFKSINIPTNDLKILQKLNCGYFSTLYLSIHMNSGELLMVKEVNSVQMSKEIWTSIYSKLFQLSNLRHPFIIEVVGAHFCEPYQIIERFCTGKSLFELIHHSSKNINQNAPLSDSNLTKIAYQIADGMMFLHSNGIVHCDLNSSNILITDEGIAKITNSSLSGMIYSYNNANDLFSFQQSSYRMIGNLERPNYLAPEILKKKKFGPKADVYSFGILLWEIAMKEIPFNGMSYQSICDYVISKNKRLSINLPMCDELIRLINSCLSPNPNDRPNFSEIVDLFKEGKITFKLNQKSNNKYQVTQTFHDLSSIPLDYKYIEKIIKDPSNNVFPVLIKFLINNMTSEIQERIRSIYSLSPTSVSSLSPTSFASLFLSLISCLNFDSFVLLTSKILNPKEFPSFLKLCGMNMINSLSSFSSVSLLASYAEFFSTIPDDCFEIISEYIPQLVNKMLNSTTLAKISLSPPSKIDPDIVFYIFHFISRLDHEKYLQNRKMQVYLLFSCEMIELIGKQTDIDAFARVLPLIEEYMSNEQIEAVVDLLEKDLIVPFPVFEFLLKKIKKEGMCKVILILLKTALKRNIESELYDLLHIVADDDFECLLPDVDEVFEILQIMIVEKISLKAAYFVIFQLSKLASMRNYIINSFQFPILNLILDSDEYFEMKFHIFSQLYSNEIFCNEMQKNKITTRIIDQVLNGFQNASESSIEAILSFVFALSSHQTGCQLLKDEDILQPFSQMFFLSSQKDLPLSLNIIINISNARMEIPQPALIVSCLMHDLLKPESDQQSILTALRNIIGLASCPCVQEIDLQHSIMPLLAVDVDPKIITLALQLISVCEMFVLRHLYVQLIEKIAVLLASLMTCPDIVRSSLSVLNAISAQFNLKPYLEQIRLIELIDSLIQALKADSPKLADQLLNLKNRLSV